MLRSSVTGAPLDFFIMTNRGSDVYVESVPHRSACTSSAGVLVSVHPRALPVTGINDVMLCFVSNVLKVLMNVSHWFLVR